LFVTNKNKQTNTVEVAVYPGINN